MKVLFLNRRCTKHPQRGGAEVYTMELARALISIGAKVEWFASRPKGLPAEEYIEGIRFIRKGNELTTHIYGFLHALKKPKDWLVVEEFNGLGYLTFFLKNSILLIHQLYEEFWTAELGPLGYPFRLLEKLLLRLYRKKSTITVSESTAEDLRSIGFRDITIIHNGLDIEPSISEKSQTLTLAYMGRLKKTKNPEDALKAYMIVKEKVKDAKIYVIGDGPLRPYLESKYGTVDGVVFTGYVENQEKYQLLRKSHVLLVPSIREGWAQVVIQANAVGTPAIGYRVQGLKDSIKDGTTGFLVRDYQEMAQKTLLLWEDKELYKRLSTNAVEWARNFSWEKTKAEFINYLKDRGLL